MNRTKCMCVRAFLSFRVCFNSNGRDKYYGIFSGVKYANLVAKRTVKSTTKEIARELEKMLVEKLSKKKITEFIRRLKEE